MATELVTFKLESGFLKEIDYWSKNANYQSRTEFIRESLRNRINEIKLRSLMGAARELTPKEKKEQRKKLSKMSESEIFRKVGLDGVRTEVFDVSGDD